jgi:hypothetical protein
MDRAMTEDNRTIRLTHDDEVGVGYLELPGDVRGGKVARSLRLSDLVQLGDNPDLVFDFSSDGILVGVEILYDD